MLWTWLVTPRASVGAEIDDEVKAADAQLVVLFERCLQDLLAVDLHAVKAVQVDDLPAAVGEEQPAVPPADVGQRQADVGLGVPAEDHVGPIDLDLSPGLLQDQAHGREGGWQVGLGVQAQMAGRSGEAVASEWEIG